MTLKERFLTVVFSFLYFSPDQGLMHPSCVFLYQIPIYKECIGKTDFYQRNSENDKSDRTPNIQKGQGWR